MNRRLLIAAGLAAAATAASAEEAKKDGGRKALSGYDLAPVAVPVVVDGQVVNYIFISVRLLPTANADNSVMRAKEAFFRDALVRAAHDTPFTRPNDYNSVDEAKVVSAMLAAAPAIVGKGQVRAVIVTKQQPRNIVSSPRRPLASAHG